MPYVYSTLTASQNYTGYKPHVEGQSHNVPEKHVLIKGGSNVAGRHLHTPIGIATKVTDDELKFLEQHPIFKLHQENGFIKVSTANEDTEKVAGDMETRDKAAPLVPQDFEGKEGAKPVDGIPEKKGFFERLKGAE